MTTAAPTFALADEIDRFRRAGATADGLALAQGVGYHVLCHGRHRLGDPLLTALDAIRRGHGGRDLFLDAYLDAVLARRRLRFRNQSYLALPLLELVRADLGIDHERMSALLMADVVRHELRPSRPSGLDHRTRETRARHAARFVVDVDPALDFRWRPGPWFALTVLPVSPEHDEYFFIRSLQAHEMVFTTLTEHVRGATEALRDGDVAAATAGLHHATRVFGRAAMLFRLVATMRRSAFQAFRQHTDGASAIQSEAYKRFELACGRPTTARMESEAFDNVPEVRAEASSADSFTQAWHDVGDPDSAELVHAVERLEAVHQRWKTTHHALAASMLGDAHGSGYTEGVPYLHGCLDNRLFGLRAREVRRSPMAA